MDDGPPRKRLQSDTAERRIAELEPELADANKKIVEQGYTIRELTISLEAARDKERDKECIISEKDSIIKMQKDASENAASVRIMTAEKKYRDQANRRVKEATEEANRRLKEKTEEANRRLKEKTEEANRRLKEKTEEANRRLKEASDEAKQRENLLNQWLDEAKQREKLLNRRLDEANIRGKTLMRELAKAQDLHQQTKKEGKMLFGFLKTGVEAFEHMAQTKSTIADRHGEKITHLKTVGKILGDESISPFGVQVTREDSESQHLSGHRYTMIQGTQASIDDRCGTPIGTFIPTVDPDFENLRFQSTCEELMNRHTIVPSGLVFNLSWYSPHLEWTDASIGNLFTKEDVERALSNLSLATEDNTLVKLTDSVNALVVAVPQDREELETETTNIRSRLTYITEWMNENGTRFEKDEPIKRRFTI